MIAALWLAGSGLGLYSAVHSPVKLIVAGGFCYGLGNSIEAIWLKVNTLIGRQDSKVMHGFSAAAAFAVSFSSLYAIKECGRIIQKHGGYSYQGAIIFGAGCALAGIIQSSYNRTHSGPAEEGHSK